MPLGSLTQRTDRDAVTCASCGSARTTRLALQLTDGTPVVFTSCHVCSHRSWTTSSGDVPLSDVLRHTTRR